MIAGIVLAAGLSRRFGEENKLLVPFPEEPLIRRVVERALSFPVDLLVVVTGYQAEEVWEAARVKDRRLQRVHNPFFRYGRASSLRRGLRALPPATKLLFVFLGDHPFAEAAVGEALLRCAERHPRKKVFYPTYWGAKGNPTLFRRSWFKRLEGLRGEETGYPLFLRFPEEVCPILVRDPRILWKIETWEDYRRYLPYARPPRVRTH